MVKHLFPEAAKRLAKIVDFQKIVQVFPQDLDPAILERLDRCTRRAEKVSGYCAFEKTGIANVDARLLTDVKAILFEHLAYPSFRKEFIREFSDVLGEMLAAVEDRAKYDDIRLFRAETSHLASLAGKKTEPELGALTTGLVAIAADGLSIS